MSGADVESDTNSCADSDSFSNGESESGADSQSDSKGEGTATSDATATVPEDCEDEDEEECPEVKPCKGKKGGGKCKNIQKAAKALVQPGEGIRIQNQGGIISQKIQKQLRKY